MTCHETGKSKDLPDGHTAVIFPDQGPLDLRDSSTGTFRHYTVLLGDFLLRREDPPISLTERDLIFRFLQSPTFSPAVLTTETAHRLARLSLQLNEEATDILDAQSLQQESLVRFQLPRIGPRDYGPRGIVATSREPPSASIGSSSENHDLFESSILLSDLLSRLEGETPLGLGLGIRNGRTTPPSPSVYDSDLVTGRSPSVAIQPRIVPNRAASFASSLLSSPQGTLLKAKAATQG